MGNYHELLVLCKHWRQLYAPLLDLICKHNWHVRWSDKLRRTCVVVDLQTEAQKKFVDLHIELHLKSLTFQRDLVTWHYHELIGLLVKGDELVNRSFFESCDSL